MRNIIAPPLYCTTTHPIGLKESPTHELLMGLCNPVCFALVCLKQSTPLSTNPTLKARALINN